MCSVWANVTKKKAHVLHINEAHYTIYSILEHCSFIYSELFYVRVRVCENNDLFSFWVGQYSN